jgi:hypothetical protein
MNVLEARLRVEDLIPKEVPAFVEQTEAGAREKRGYI